MSFLARCVNLLKQCAFWTKSAEPADVAKLWFISSDLNFFFWGLYPSVLCLLRWVTYYMPPGQFGSCSSSQNNWQTSRLFIYWHSHCGMNSWVGYTARTYMYIVTLHRETWQLDRLGVGIVVWEYAPFPVSNLLSLKVKDNLPRGTR